METTLEKGTAVAGKIIGRTSSLVEDVMVEGEVISVLERTVVVSTKTHGNVMIKKQDLRLNT